MSTPLEQAPTHVKLAVDLIMLLEEHDLPAEEVMAALEIVRSDFQKKLNNQQKN
ncbi:DUF2496 domain-containing protein [Pseudoalteromonas sp. OANN1]|uniref:DUF2496 domain-containing protein n=1 Tax=Pseudoalteromonas TaxID=53246 RepID=UPI002096FF10|nr:DUF2496 domain-containing protein [Pseudoalteromonas sp. OANN1]MCO7197827.1 YbaM family protein [Pseudoalteromonas sp. OANN1]